MSIDVMKVRLLGATIMLVCERIRIMNTLYAVRMSANVHYIPIHQTYCSPYTERLRVTSFALKP